MTEKFYHNLTPMMAQYLDIKKKITDCLLFFRMGDFYELFFEDAKIAAPVMDVVLTRRGKQDGLDIPMCGVPFHASDMYLSRLTRAGYKVAVCEQIESPSEAKKRGPKSVVKREITRISRSCFGSAFSRCLFQTRRRTSGYARRYGAGAF